MSCSPSHWATRRTTLGVDGLVLPTGILAAVLAGLIVVEIALARLADRVVGDSDAGLVAGGLAGALVVAPVWSLLLAARLARPSP